MSYCTFIAADCELPEKPWPDEDYPLDINIDAGTVFDKDADDNYALLAMDNDISVFTGRTSAVALCWNYYTNGRANQIVDYIKTALLSCDVVEIWRVWLSSPSEGLCPSVEKHIIPVSLLSLKDIELIDKADPFDGEYNKCPVYYCLKIVR